MKIEINFWLWLCRFAYKQMKKPIDKLPVGIPSMRDPDDRCSGYTPRKRLLGDAPADCLSNGHYLCGECAFFDKEGYEEICS